MSQNTYLQKNILPKSIHIQSYNKTIIPFTNENIKNISKAEFKDYLVKPKKVALTPINLTVSYTLTNSKFTVVESLSNGVIKSNSIVPSQINVKSDKKIISNIK